MRKLSWHCGRPRRHRGFSARGKSYKDGKRGHWSDRHGFHSWDGDKTPRTTWGAQDLGRPRPEQLFNRQPPQGTRFAALAGPSVWTLRCGPFQAAHARPLGVGSRGVGHSHPASSPGPGLALGSATLPTERLRTPQNPNTSLQYFPVPKRQDTLQGQRARSGTTWEQITAVTGCSPDGCEVGSICTGEGGRGRGSRFYKPRARFCPPWPVQVRRARGCTGHGHGVRPARGAEPALSARLCRGPGPTQGAGHTVSMREQLDVQRGQPYTTHKGPAAAVPPRAVGTEPAPRGAIPRTWCAAIPPN